MGSNPYPQEPPKKGWATWIIVGVLGCVALPVVVAILGIVAAIAIPSFLRARIAANEAQNLADVRTLISAETTYQSTGGRYGTLECLEAPSSCLKSYSGAKLLDPESARTERGGYRRTFDLSPDGEGFTYLAVPLEADKTGRRAFCGDGTGIVCETSGSQPRTRRGRCEVDSSCTPVR
jgi:type II secretory pathway pseudopilin PulG